ncbi:MAG: hypothetical protein UHS50_07770, partial [Bacteroidaceae bacterium]|nr:hypothetical protein [Bacteroidaceae bacterium]
MGWLALLILEKGQCEGLTTGVSTEKQTPTSFLFPHFLGLTAEFWGHRRHRFYFSLLMKKFLISLVMLLNVSVAGLFAQSSSIATLNHEGDISVFYGANALKEAHELAVHGDVITLSSGMFLAIDISKNLTIRGAGMQVDTVSMCMPTIITGDLSISGENTAINGLTIEGIYHNHQIKLNGTIENVLFAKCRFKSFSCSSTMKNATFLHCLITNKINLTSCTGKFVNSIINNPDNNSGYAGGSWEFINCYVKFGDCNRHNAEAEQYIY